MDGAKFQGKIGYILELRQTLERRNWLMKFVSYKFPALSKPKKFFRLIESFLHCLDSTFEHFAW